MENVSVQNVKTESYDQKKAESDQLNHHWIYLFVRPVSFYFTPFFINRGISANSVTLLGIIPLLISVAGLIYGGYHFSGFVIGAIFANIWLLMDVIDGNVARYTRTSSDFGWLLDSLIGSLVKVLIPLSAGIGLMLAGEEYGLLNRYTDFPQNWYLYLSIAWVVAVLFRQNMSLLWLHIMGRGEHDQMKQSLINRIARYLLSYDLPLLFLFALIGWVDLWLIFYGAYNIISPIGILVINLSKAIRQRSALNIRNDE